MLRYRTAATVPADSPFEAGWRAGLSGGSPIFGAKSRSSAAEFRRGFEGGRQERQRIAAAQARAAAPLPRATFADAYLRGAIAGQRTAQAQFGGDPRVAQAYRAGFDAVQSGDVLVDRRISWRQAGGWRVKPLVMTPGDIREIARALGD